MLSIRPCEVPGVSGESATRSSDDQESRALRADAVFNESVVAASLFCSAPTKKFNDSAITTTARPIATRSSMSDIPASS